MGFIFQSSLTLLVLDTNKAKESSLGASSGFYLATNQNDAWYFAGLHGGEHTVIKYQIKQTTVEKLFQGVSQLDFKFYAINGTVFIPHPKANFPYPINPGSHEPVRRIRNP